MSLWNGKVQEVALDVDGHYLGGAKGLMGSTCIWNDGGTHVLRRMIPA